VAAAFPDLGSPTTIAEISPDNSELIAGWRQLADVAVIASLIIAACSLAVSVASGLVDRKRPLLARRLVGPSIELIGDVPRAEIASGHGALDGA
jgi:hypothetical protein